MRFAYCTLTDQSGHDAGRALLARLYREETGKDLPPIAVTALGKPYFPDVPLYFSISHTPRHAFCVLSKHNVGLDAEELDREVKPRLADRLLSPGERAQYDAAEDKRRALLTFWVLKEAAGKLSGRGMQPWMNDTDFSLEDPALREVDGCIVAILQESEHH